MKYSMVYTGAMIASLAILGCNKTSSGNMSPSESSQQHSSQYKLPYNLDDPLSTKILALEQMVMSIRDSTGALVRIIVCNNSRMGDTNLEENVCYGAVALPNKEGTKEIDIDLLDSTLTQANILEL